MAVSAFALATRGVDSVIICGVESNGRHELSFEDWKLIRLRSRRDSGSFYWLVFDQASVCQSLKCHHPPRLIHGQTRFAKMAEPSCQRVLDPQMRIRPHTSLSPHLCRLLRGEKMSIDSGAAGTEELL